MILTLFSPSLNTHREFHSLDLPQIDSVSMDGKEKPESKSEKKAERSSKRLVQSQLNTVPSSVKSSSVSERRPLRQQRNSSSDAEPTTPGAGISELKHIQESLTEIRKSMVKKDDIKSIVTAILSEIKGEIKKEIVAEVKETVSQEIINSVRAQVKDEFENKLDEKAKSFIFETKEIAQGVNLDIANIRERFQEQLKELRTLQNAMKRYKSLTETALTIANQNQQYSQKNNIKFLGWKEKAQENLREDLCEIMKNAAKVDIDPTDILDIHRIPGAEGKSRPVIAKFKNAESKFKVIRHRSREAVKKHFAMFDHLTQMNSQLLRDLNKDEKIESAWYFNGKIFGLDKKGNRHRYDVMDTDGMKLHKL